MGLFDLFRKRAHSKAVQRHIGEANAMSAALLSASGVEFDSASKLEQALIGTFYFGMLTAHGMLHALSPREVHELALASFELGLHYTPAAAMEATEECIAAATPGRHDAMNAILHRGIDGHRQYLVGEGLAENIRSVLAHYEKK